MADIIFVTSIAMVVFFIIRGELKKLSRGRCGGGGSGDKSSYSGCADTPIRKKEHI